MPSVSHDAAATCTIESPLRLTFMTPQRTCLQLNRRATTSASDRQL